MYNIFSNICLGIFIVLVLMVIYKYIKKHEINDNNKVLNFIDKHYKIIFMIILVIFLFTRLYTLTSNPYRLHIDEAASIYNAYTIAKYGVDRYQNIYPIYFLNFNAGQSAMYTYMAALLIKVFGYSLFIARIPAVICGLFTLVAGYLLGKEIKGKSFGLLVVTIITICPYFVMNSRWGLDCNLMLGFFSISIYLLLKAIKSGKKYMYAVSGTLFGLTLYTYALSYIIVPIVLLLALIYLIYLKKINLKQVISFCIPFVILFIPVILDLLIEFGIIDEIKTRFFSIPKMNDDRVSEVGFSYILDNLKYIGSYFTDRGNPFEYFDYGTLYIFSIPLIILGIVYVFYNAIKSIKSKEFNVYTYLSLIMIGCFLSLILVVDGFKVINKGNATFILFAILLAIGLYVIFKYIKYSYIPILLIYLIAFTSFNYYYFTENSYYEYTYDDDLIPMREYMDAVENAYARDKTVFVDLYIPGISWSKVYIGLATKMSPYFYTETEDHMQNIYFYVPFDYDKDNVYILNSRSHYDDFIQHGFTCNKYGTVYEYYYKEDN